MVKKGSFRNRKVFRQIMLIAVEVELIAIVCLCVGIHNTSFAHYMSDLSEWAGFNISYASVIPLLPANTNAGIQAYEEDTRWKGPVLSRSRGTITGPSGKETYYNLNMNGVVKIMRRMGNTDEYWVREDGVKMLGDYVMVAANLNLRPRGSLIETSLGTGIVCDTGTFARRNPTQLDIAVTW